jgi:hypothetical protein
LSEIGVAAGGASGAGATAIPVSAGGFSVFAQAMKRIATQSGVSRRIWTSKSIICDAA